MGTGTGKEYHAKVLEYLGVNPRRPRRVRSGSSQRKAVKGVLRRKPHTKNGEKKAKLERASDEAAGAAPRDIVQKRLASVPEDTAKDALREVLEDMNEVEALAAHVYALGTPPPPDPDGDDVDDDLGLSDNDSGGAYSSDECGEVYSSDDGANSEDEWTAGGKSLDFANKTSLILSSCQDFLSGIGGIDDADKNNAGKTDPTIRRKSYVRRLSNDGTVTIPIIRTTANDSRGGSLIVAGGSSMHGELDPNENLHEVSVPQGDKLWPFVDADLSGQKRYLRSFFKKVRWDLFGLMVLCFVAGMWVDAIFGQSKGNGIGEGLRQRDHLRDGTGPPVAEGQVLVHGSLTNEHAPKWFNRTMGWEGNTYTDAIAFCAKQDSYIPCTYEEICPDGPGSVPAGGYVAMKEEWAPIITAPNSWVQIGNEKNTSSTSCMDYNSLHDVPPVSMPHSKTPRIMCCKDTMNRNKPNPLTVVVAGTKHEQDILNDMKPQWFGRKHGYKGTTHERAAAFCKGIGDMVLCPVDAICPSGRSEKKLFLQREPFEGEQWAPVAAYFEKVNVWVSVGEHVGENPQHPFTCITYDQIFSGSGPPSWGVDGSRTEIKENVLCCQNPDRATREVDFNKHLNPIWLDASHGWGKNGWSHDKALEFCEALANRKLCPYDVYCPNGEGQPAAGGHVTNFDTVGEQWAPTFGDDDRWVMIGQKYQNRATTCMKNGNLPMPDWETMAEEQGNLKKYILCCSF